jgi:hypothetical protein
MPAIVGTAPRLPGALSKIRNQRTLKAWQNSQRERIEREEKTNSARVREWENAQRGRIEREAAERRKHLKQTFVKRVKNVIEIAKNARRTLRERLQNRIDARRGHTIVSIHGGKGNRTRKNRR